jgi:hypothetical protein
MSLEYGVCGIFKLLRWMHNLHQFLSDHGILYANKSLEDEQLLIRPPLRESKIMNMEGRSNLNFTLYFVERTH